MDIINMSRALRNHTHTTTVIFPSSRTTRNPAPRCVEIIDSYEYLLNYDTLFLMQILLSVCDGAESLLTTSTIDHLLPVYTCLKEPFTPLVLSVKRTVYIMHFNHFLNAFLINIAIHVHHDLKTNI